ncbi:MAG: 2-oxoglutarate dehydrogenase E1 component [Pseudomonadota bacterium]|nr:2-oxoglutarate dehydrogenase E1 component [Pseudomonadota bacterium]
MQDWWTSSYLTGGSDAYLEDMYDAYLQDPQSVSHEWQTMFAELPTVNGGVQDVSHEDIRNYMIELVKKPRAAVAINQDAAMEHKQRNVERLINAYRVHGHLAAQFDPLGEPRPEVRDLELSFYDLSNNDLDLQFRAPHLMSKPTASLREIIAALRTIYCQKIGAEFMYITEPEELTWVTRQFESYKDLKFSSDTKRKILTELVAADGLEKYLGAKFPGQKRFSLEGGDSFIPLLKGIIERAGDAEVAEIAIGMAHRGRLNVLINVMGQSPDELFQEFEGTRSYGLTSGDVKYHLGFSSDIETAAGNPVHLTLAFNPSHLEVISAVVMGSVRARQDRHHDTEHKKAMAIMVHGDAAIAGQGIVMETINMSQTRAYGIGGSLHIVINNQVGFTTSFAHDARSSQYCTDIAKMINAPVFHVNADDPEAVLFLAQLAVDYRNTFHKDIIIDLVCYRRHGHNEADEPMATQPLMYNKIKEHKAPREYYAERLIEQGVITTSDVDTLWHDYNGKLDKRLSVVNTVKGVRNKLAEAFAPYLSEEWQVVADTTVPLKTLQTLASRIATMPAHFTLQRQVGNLVENRLKMATGEKPFDWGFAENMAYATLLNEGYSIRLSGQDVRRGTFAHRHATFHDQVTGESITPLKLLDSEKANFQIYDSLLSEQGVLGFEFGYAQTLPRGLVIWEAQFGDFANGAQVVIDQFISSAWQKWQRLCGLVLLLPHGYEGMGPEHSSARLERFLQLCAQHNMQVCVPTTPAQVFHMLRRQVLRPYRKPLIVMSPKSVLRHRLAISEMAEFSEGHFQNVMPEVDDIKPATVRKVILCSGKVYYDLLEKRRDNKQNDIAIVRIEQLYPFPYDELKAELTQYPKATQVVWCQEEPKNQGAWFITQHRLLVCLGM